MLRAGSFVSLVAFALSLAIVSPLTAGQAPDYWGEQEWSEDGWTYDHESSMREQQSEEYDHDHGDHNKSQAPESVKDLYYKYRSAKVKLDLSDSQAKTLSKHFYAAKKRLQKLESHKRYHKVELKHLAHSEDENKRYKAMNIIDHIYQLKSRTKKVSTLFKFNMADVLNEQQWDKLSEYFWDHKVNKHVIEK